MMGSFFFRFEVYQCLKEKSESQLNLQNARYWKVCNAQEPKCVLVQSKLLVEYFEKYLLALFLFWMITRALLYLELTQCAQKTRFKINW